MLESHRCYCPYCGEVIELLLDLSVQAQTYVEDCFVCCRPMVVTVEVEGGIAEVRVVSEDE